MSDEYPDNTAGTHLARKVREQHQRQRASSFVPAHGSAIDDTIRERDAYFTEAARTKETLAEIIPALEIASKCKADDLRSTCPGNSLTPDEWAALWMARAILEANP